MSPQSPTARIPQPSFCALLSSSLMGLLWRSKRTLVTRATPATCEQAQAQTMGGLARRSFRPARSDHLPALKRLSISGQFTTFHQALM